MRANAAQKPGQHAPKAADKQFFLIGDVINSNGDASIVSTRILEKHGFGPRRGYVSVSYVVEKLLGSGAFGQVYRCKNIETSESVAIKVIKSDPMFVRFGLVEIGMLTVANTCCDPNGDRHIVKMHDHFVFKGHVCIVMELLGPSLAEIQAVMGYTGFRLSDVRNYIRQMATCLEGLEIGGLIHCDLKPENILYERNDSTLARFDPHTIKVADFGSACSERMRTDCYMQSRYYRAPEVIVGAPHTKAIDMWSLGCVAAELFLGVPLLSGKNEYYQLARTVDMFGKLPNAVIEKGKYSKRYFMRYGAGYTFNGPSLYFSDTHKEFVSDHPKLPGKYLLDTLTQRCGSRETPELIRQFENMLRGMLDVRPLKRWTADQVLAHPFVRGAPPGSDCAQMFDVPVPALRFSLRGRGDDEWFATVSPRSSAAARALINSGAAMLEDYKSEWCHGAFSAVLRGGRVVDPATGEVIVSLSPAAKKTVPSGGTAIANTGGRFGPLDPKAWSRMVPVLPELAPIPRTSVPVQNALDAIDDTKAVPRIGTTHTTEPPAAAAISEAISAEFDYHMRRQQQQQRTDYPPQQPQLSPGDGVEDGCEFDVDSPASIIVDAWGVLLPSPVPAAPPSSPEDRRHAVKFPSICGPDISPQPPLCRPVPNRVVQFSRATTAPPEWQSAPGGGGGEEEVSPPGDMDVDVVVRGTTGSGHEFPSLQE